MIAIMDSLLKEKIQSDLKKALQHLNYSFEKVQKMGLVRKKNWSEEELEVLESFSSRFARTSDIFISQYLRFLILQTDPAFRGSIIDSLNFAEKQNLIGSSKIWLRIRELRNVAAHEYTAEDMTKLFQELLTLTPEVLKLKQYL